MPATADEHRTLDLARTAEAAALADLQNVTAERDRLATEHAAAAEAFDRDPSDRKGKATIAAREARDLAELRMEASGRRLAAARASVTAAEDVIARAQLADDTAAARAAVEAAEVVHREALARVEGLRAAAPGRTLGARIARALVALAADERKALAAVTEAGEESAASRRTLDDALDRLVAIDPGASTEIAARRAEEKAIHKAAEDARLAHAGSVPGLIEALRTPIALRRAAAELLTLAEVGERNAVAELDAARAALGEAPLPFGSFGKKGGRTFALAFVWAEMHQGERGRSFWSALKERLGTGWPEGATPGEWWARLTAGETPAEIAADLARVKLDQAIVTANHPVRIARAAAAALEHGRASGAWARPEAELAALIDKGIEVLSAVLAADRTAQAYAPGHPIEAGASPEERIAHTIGCPLDRVPPVPLPPRVSRGRDVDLLEHIAQASRFQTTGGTVAKASGPNAAAKTQADAA